MFDNNYHDALLMAELGVDDGGREENTSNDFSADFDPFADTGE